MPIRYISRHFQQIWPDHRTVRSPAIVSTHVQLTHTDNLHYSGIMSAHSIHTIIPLSYPVYYHISDDLTGGVAWGKI